LHEGLQFQGIQQSKKSSFRAWKKSIGNILNLSAIGFGSSMFEMACTVLSAERYAWSLVFKKKKESSFCAMNPSQNNAV
jgi:hypothetical protein